MPAFHEQASTLNAPPEAVSIIAAHQSYPENRPDDPAPKKLILCFDGTSNSFQGDDSDTNVVKLFEMLDRRDKQQYHYYQPGIGTYAAYSKISNVQKITMGARLASTLDEMTASSFAEHVLAGYKWLMKYYMENDKVYIFGFSRGAYTARVLTELLDSVGLLSKGNDENLPFLWYQYSQYRRNPTDAAKRKLSHMSSTFCRVEPPKNVDEEDQRRPFVYFLGLWDCVNSVARFSDDEIDIHANASPNIALHVRHAVSCHERRVMFRPTLFLNDVKNNSIGTCNEEWFAGNHGNIGGGWPRVEPDSLLLSDIPLIWMVEQVREQEKKDAEKLHISWRAYTRNNTGFVNTFEYRKQQLDTGLRSLKLGRASQRIVNDTLNFRRCGGRGVGKMLMVAVWWLMECLPLKHPNLKPKKDALQSKSKGEAPIQYTTETSIWPNLGGPRRIPIEGTGKIHESVQLLLENNIIHAGPKLGSVSILHSSRGDFRYFDPVR